MEYVYCRNKVPEISDLRLPLLPFSAYISPMEMFHLLGETLALLRQMRGLTQEELAAKARMGKNQISRYENNHQQPQLRQLARILDALEVSHQEFAYALAAVQQPARVLERSDQADAGREALSPRLMFFEGGTLVPVAVETRVTGIITELVKLAEATKDVLLGRAVREAEKG